MTNQDARPFRLTGRHLIGWCLVDFSCSLLMANGGIYFAAWLVVDNNVPGIWLNLTFILNTVAVLILAPIVGTLADRLQRPILLLGGAASVMFLSTVGLYIVVHVVSAPTRKAVLALVTLWVILCAYQFAMVFYNSILKRLLSHGATTALSGLGVAAGWLGAVIGVLYVLPFVSGLIPFVPGGRGEAFLPSALGFAALMMAAFLLMPSDRDLASAYDFEQFNKNARPSFGDVDSQKR